MEIINLDQIHKIVGTAPYTADHSALLAALRERYPGQEFNHVGSRGPWTRRLDTVVDSSCRVVSEHYREWITAEYKSARGMAPLFAKYADAGLQLIEEEGLTVIVTIPYGSSADAFFQLQIPASHRTVMGPVFSKYWQSENLQDLLDPFRSSDGEPISVTPWAYEPDDIQLTNVRRYMQDIAELRYAEKLEQLPEVERKIVRVITVSGDRPQQQEDVPFLDLHPDWLERPCNEVRFMADWQESSAGSYRLCDHWWLNLRDYEIDGRRSMAFVPYWATADGERVNEVTTTEEETVYSLMDRLVGFDSRAGYPFAWYFYMLHGNRVHYSVGVKISEGIEAGRIHLPERDERVLQRWIHRQYGF